ncbi:hypothetical protein MASR2M8_17780 [Opitutaceae bacterium]
MVAIALLAMFAISAITALFRDRSAAFDEMGLFNPIYLYYQDGVMRYPAHGHYNNMVVHPPMIYWIIGSLMKVGLNPFHAAALWLTIGTGLIYWHLLRGPFGRVLRLSLGMGVCIAVFFINWVLTLRPDVHLAVYWFAGLLALERARLTSWPLGLCFLGSLCLTLAAAFHYIGLGALLAVGVYAVYLLVQEGWARSRRPLLALIAGGCLVGIPYLIVWAIPDREAILAMTASVQGEGGSAGIATAFNYYLDTFAAIRRTGTGYYEPLVAAFMKPMIWLQLTPAAIALPGLFLWRKTRFLTMAAAPHIFFVIFFVRGGLKKGYLLYYTPEFIFYCSALCALTISLAILAVSQVSRAKQISMTVVSILCVGILIGAAFFSSSRQYQPRHRDWEFARYAGQTIMGGEAIAAMSSAGPWYTSGAKQVHFIQRDIIERPSLDGIDLREFFSRFDGTILYGQNSHAAYNDQRFSLSRGLADGLFKTKGFYFDDTRNWFASAAAYVILHPSAVDPIIGFAQRGGKFYRYDQDPSGNHNFVLWVGPPPMGETWWLAPRFLSQFALPGDSPSSAAPESIHSFLFDSEQLSSLREKLSERGRFLSEVAVRETELNTRDWEVPDISRGDHISFPSDQGPLLRAQNLLEPMSIQPAPNGEGFSIQAKDRSTEPAFSLFRSVSADTAFNPDTGELTTPSEKWAYAVIMGPINFPDSGKYWIELDYACLKGRLAFGALTADQSRWQTQVPIDVGNANPDTKASYRSGFEIDVGQDSSHWLLLTNNQVKDQPSLVTIKDVNIARIKRVESHPISSPSP